MEKYELLKTAKPILFNTEMVKAILDGRKTVTRRVVKPQPIGGICNPPVEPPRLEDLYGNVLRQPYQPGDILYVRETWAVIATGGENHRYGYKADNDWLVPMWRPSIHMPRDAARIFLKVTGVLVEKLQDITEKQAISEGCQPLIKSARYVFADVWDSTIKPADRARYGWDSDPWVWVVEFERIEVSEDA